MTGRPTNLAASIRQRLLDRSRTRGEDHQILLVRYALERLLARLAASPERDRFVLKGAFLFALWADRPHRATRDLDLLGRGDPSLDKLVDTFRDIVKTAVEPDGLIFDAEGIRAAPIREAAHYEGVRLTVPAALGKTRFRLQVDVGFGDAVHPRPRLVSYPAVLDHAPPRIKAYPREAVVGEKLQALVALGMVNSRMKDIHDLWTLAHEHAFDGETLAASIAATFRRRSTAIPNGPPVAFTTAFTDDASRRTLWSAFLDRVGLSEPRTLSDAMALVSPFALPALGAARDGQPLAKRWKPGGPWRSGTR
ncbi:nucleotidyl transferase AbiEii/AbiGii toxin family protein [bacterium]|nr:MAG: nucleotidyl transferase AbiEii/AbiGii toxin family protein [bacterium]